MWRGVHACVILASLLATRAQDVETGPHKPYSYDDDEGPVLVPSVAWRYLEKCRPYQSFLTLDGGGLRGIISTTVLLQIEKQIKLHILSNLDDYTLDHPKQGKTKDSYNFNTITDFSIYLADFFHGVSGISAGSWLASYIVTKGGHGHAKKILKHPSTVEKFGSIRPGSIEGLRVFFLEYGSQIYPNTLLPVTFKPRPFALPAVKPRLLFTSQFTPVGLEWLLKEFLGNTRLSQVSTSFFVVAFDLSRMSAVEFIADYLDVTKDKKNESFVKPNIYTGVCISQSDVGSGSDSGRSGSSETTVDDKEDASGKYMKGKCGRSEGYAGMDELCDLDYYVRDIARASSAFPMVHPAKLVKPLNDVTNYFEMIDGAMVGNNPTLATIAWALSHKHITSISTTAFLSLGTGFAEGSYEMYASSGFVGWAGPMINLLTAATPEYIQAMIDYVFYIQNEIAAPLKPNQLLRIQLVKDADTPEGATLGSISPGPQAIRKMEEMGQMLGAQYSENIQQFVKTFLCYRKEYGTDGCPKEE